MARPTRLSPAARRTFQVAAALCFLAGAGLEILAVWAFLNIDLADGPAAAFNAFALLLVGGVLFVGATLLAGFGFARPISGIMSTETEDAVENTMAAAGRGVAAGLRSLGASPIRVKCRHCGFLETDDAEFCSRCAATL